MEEKEDVLEEVKEPEVSEKIEENTSDEFKVETADEIQEKKEEIIENIPEGSEDKKPKKKGKGKIIFLIILLLLIVGACLYMFVFKDPLNLFKKKKNIENKSTEVLSDYRITDNGVQDFDLYFMQLENEEKNKVYSPLSIKYALEMLSEGAKGDTKSQIDSIIGDYKARKYNNNSNMSFANALFIRDGFNVKDKYKNKLKDTYNAELITDPFNNATTMNNWVNEKTLKLIPKLLEDSVVQDSNFILINALAIDMNWNNQIHCATGSTVPCINYSVRFAHEKIEDDALASYFRSGGIYDREEDFPALKFDEQENIKSAEVLAHFNRYDAVKEIGEEKIREVVGNEYRKYLEKEETKLYDPDAEKDVNKFLDQYIKELDSNYKQEGSSTDFLLYEDDSVKSFAKDLKEYDGTTLQYVGIMPKETKLVDYVANLKAKDVSNVINNLKEMKLDNFNDGVLTLIDGKIPMFDFEYDLALMKDLQKLGIKDVFDGDKADLTNITDSKPQFIGDARHKANIEFSNDGIKAAAATSMAGFGGTGGGFEYLFKVPVEKIDITFDKPYMFLIRDKATGEVWFAGTVYEPKKKNS